MRNVSFEYFIDVCAALKGRVPLKLFFAKAEEILYFYNKERHERGEELEVIDFSNRWFKGWCEESHVSMKHPNKHFHQPKEKKMSNN